MLDEVALIDGLQNNCIQSAALDVCEFERIIGAEFFELENIVLAPDNGTATIETRNEMSRLLLNI